MRHVQATVRKKILAQSVPRRCAASPGPGFGSSKRETAARLFVGSAAFHEDRKGADSPGPAYVMLRVISVHAMW